eukprot:scaffold39364_cov63-Phaeocystis_antarctica.AAC.1
MRRGESFIASAGGCDASSVTRDARKSGSGGGAGGSFAGTRGDLSGAAGVSFPGLLCGRVARCAALLTANCAWSDGSRFAATCARMRRALNAHRSSRSHRSPPTEMEITGQRGSPER